MAFDIDAYVPGTCPFCGSRSVEEAGADGEARGMRCQDCGGAYIEWYDEPHDTEPVEVTDRHGRPL